MKSSSKINKNLLEKKKKESIQLINTINNQMGVSHQKMKLALIHEHYQAYDGNRPRTAKQTLSRPAFRYLSAYSKQLLIADGLHNWAERVGTLSLRQRIRYGYKTPHRMAAAAYDKAYEMLDDMLSMCMGVSKFLDRKVNFMNCAPDTRPYEAPRQIGTKSKYSQRDYYQMKTELGQFQLEYLKENLDAIDALLSGEIVPDENYSATNPDTLLDEEDFLLISNFDLSGDLDDFNDPVDPDDLNDLDEFS